MDYLLLALFSYALGAIPTGLIVGKMARGVDVRAYGSGKTGAANILRTVGPGAFILVFAADFTKGLVPVLLAGDLIGTTGAQVTAGLAALVGHNWSVFLGFRGGRGVATGVGALFGVSPLQGALVTAVTVSVILLSRYVSLGSVVGAVVAIPAMVVAVLLGWETTTDYLLYVVPGAFIVIFQHRDNIERLRQGRERRLGEPAAPQA